jgi:hypothetical protein
VEVKMGWTHYWQREIELPAKSFAEAVADCRKIFNLLKAPLGDAEGKGEPVLAEDKIIFNGANGIAVFYKNLRSTLLD